MSMSCVVYNGWIRRSAEFQALCEVYEFHINRQTGQEKADYERNRGIGGSASGMSGHMKKKVSFLFEYR